MPYRCFLLLPHHAPLGLPCPVAAHCCLECGEDHADGQLARGESGSFLGKHDAAASKAANVRGVVEKAPELFGCFANHVLMGTVSG